MTEYWVSQKLGASIANAGWQMQNLLVLTTTTGFGTSHPFKQFFKDNRQKQKEERETKIELEREMRSDKTLKSLACESNHCFEFQREVE